MARALLLLFLVFFALLGCLRAVFLLILLVAMVLTDGSFSPQYVVISNTFINVVDENDQPPAIGFFNMHRRVRSESDLRILAAAKEEERELPAEQPSSFTVSDGDAVVGGSGLSDLDTSAEATCEEDSGAPVRPPRKVTAPSVVPATTSAAANAAVAASYLTMAQVEQLISLNRTLAAENQLLRKTMLRNNQDAGSPDSCESTSGCTEKASSSKSKALKLPSQTKSSSKAAKKEAKAAPDTLEDTPVERRTTVMLRNLPNNYTRDMVMALLDEKGFSGMYNFLYLPIDFNSHAALGYAFVNLVDAQAVEKFWSTFDGYTDWIVPSKKVGTVSWSAPHQGLQGQIDRYQNSPVMHESVPDEYKPVLLEDGVRISFPEPSKNPRAPRVRRLGGYTTHWSALRAPAA
eukprot:TRINITY_DN1050_c0_g2_i1.p1 TRINITY_DN1050_c0_g2~~TRINITY_DN1050_c0_g2_i1.p1  ORF type:complete len:422 (-),score=91.18 TRINITY_DN1050_c0_g2_i1:136-1347(-)